MRLRTAICCTVLGITLVSISVLSTVLQNASAQSVPDFSLPGMTGSPPVRSGMWINNGTWWAIFSDNVSGTYFYQKVGNAFVKGAQVNPVVAGSPDTIWDGTNLFVFLQETGAQAKFYKYTYTASPEQYDLVPGFPVTIPLAGMATSATIAKDSTEKLWVAYAGLETGKG